jgi:hypothetical protein
MRDLLSLRQLVVEPGLMLCLGRMGVLELV